MAASNSFVNQLLDAAFRSQTYTGGVITMGLFSGGLPSGGGTEITGGGYARQTVSFATAVNKSIQTSTDIVFSDMPTGKTVVAYGVYSDNILIDEQLLPQTFTADITNNELRQSYKFEIGA